MSLRVLSIDAAAAIHTTGPGGSRKFGVPTGGPFDRFSAACANALVGNQPETAVLEIGGFGAMFEAIESVTLALMGPEVDATGVRGLGRWTLEAGSRLAISRLLRGARLYLAMPGGVVGPSVGGPLSLQPVRAGHVLTARDARNHPNLHAASVARPTPMLNYVASNPADPIHARLSATHLKVGLHSNRVGVRLGGFPETHDEERFSEPAAPGTIQWTPSGELIVLGPDGPTVGGYPRIGFLVDSALDALAQLRPGDAIRLSPIRFDEALALMGKVAAERERIQTGFWP